MSPDSYPADIVLTKQDFVDCGWKAALTGNAREGYSSMWQAFSSAARQAINESRQSHGKALRILADACSMMLSPDTFSEPFKPIAVFHDKRSVIPDDFPESDIAFFSQIVDEIDDPRLKARLADMVWLKQRPRDVRFALAAIDAYRLIPLTTKTWVQDGRECWERAINLAKSLRAGAGNRLQEIETAILGVFETAVRSDGFLALWLADMLKENGLGRDKKIMISQKLESLARAFDSEGDFHKAREYFRIAADWFKISGDDAKVAEMTSALAEGWAKDAAASISAAPPSYLAAADSYEKAIQIYRTIPRTKRAVHRIDERISDLHTRLNEAGEKGLEEMKAIRTPGIDISRLVEDARRAVRGKDTLEALKAFANLQRGINVKEMRNCVIERRRDYPLQSLLSATVISRDGRIIAKRAGMNLSDTVSDGDDIVIQSEMIKEYGLHVGIAVEGAIWPALEVLLIEHRLCESDFVRMARQSPIVPIGRERLFGKALFAGYDRDYMTAIHLLVPQIEHMVRFHLKQAGVKTTNLDKDGIDNENGLSALMELPEAAKVFGEDLVFEIKALFCDAFGPNLRNEIAHGLLEDDALQSASVIYAWWLGLKLVFNNYWNAARKNSGGGEDGDKK